MKTSYTIGEFSKITGLSIRTLRFYHEKGILMPSSVDNIFGWCLPDDGLTGPKRLDKMSPGRDCQRRFDDKPPFQGGESELSQAKVGKAFQAVAAQHNESYASKAAKTNS